MSKYMGILKCNNNKFFTDILINEGIITKEEYENKKEFLVIPIPYPDLAFSGGFIQGDKNKAKELFKFGEYEQLMIEAFHYSMEGKIERPEKMISIYCLEEKDKKLSLISCEKGEVLVWKEDEAIGLNETKKVYFNVEKQEFTDVENNKIDIVDLEDSEIISIYYGSFY